MKASISSLVTLDNSTLSYLSLALVKPFAFTFFFFLVPSYCLSNKVNTTFIYGEKKTPKNCSSLTQLNISTRYHFSCHFLCLEITSSLFSPLIQNSTHYLRLRPDVSSTRILALISSSGRVISLSQAIWQSWILTASTTLFIHCMC